MLVLSRKIGQQIRIGDQIVVTVVKSQGQTVRIGIEAPRDVRVLRAELPPLNEKSTAAMHRGHAQDEPTRKLHVVTPKMDDERPLPGRSEMSAQASGPSHPQRWTVASMRERVQAQVATHAQRDLYCPVQRPLHHV